MSYEPVFVGLYANLDSVLLVFEAGSNLVSWSNPKLSFKNVLTGLLWWCCPFSGAKKWSGLILRWIKVKYMAILSKPTENFRQVATSRRISLKKTARSTVEWFSLEHVNVHVFRCSSQVLACTGSTCKLPAEKPQTGNRTQNHLASRQQCYLLWVALPTLQPAATVIAATGGY